MTNIEISLDDEVYFSPLLSGGDIGFTLKKGGNLNGNIAVYTVNTPTSITFSSDFEISGNSPTLDPTKLVKIWIIYDSLIGKAIYTYQLLNAL